MVINGNVNPSTERNVVPKIPSRALSFKDDTTAAAAVVVVNEEDGDDADNDGGDNVGLVMIKKILFSLAAHTQYKGLRRHN
jgi:hypothetical protein